MIAHRATLALLAPADVESIVGEACLVLRDVGVAVENADAAGLLQAADAEARGGRWHLPERTVRDALACVRGPFRVFDRDGAEALALGAGRVHFDPGSAALHVLDRGQRRPARTEDLVALARLVDALPHYAAQSTALTPSDVPETVADRHRLWVALRHGRKPVVTGTFRKDAFAPMHAMLCAVRGGAAALAERPLALFDCCPTSPLKWSDVTAQALVDCARHGVPAVLVSVPLAGATAPVTLRDAVVQHCAENLTGLVIHQQAAPGAPLVWGGAASAFDMRRGAAPMAAPESMLLAIANAQVGRHLGLPTQGYLGLSESKGPDYQAGLESGTGALCAALAGLDIVSGPGLLDYLLTQSPEKLLLDHEACGMALRIARGLEGGGGAPALIAAIVAAGSALGSAHTRAHWREQLSIPGVAIDREAWGDWQAADARDAATRAAAEVDRLLARPPGPMLPDAVTAELDAIMQSELAAAV